VGKVQRLVSLNGAESPGRQKKPIYLKLHQLDSSLDDVVPAPWSTAEDKNVKERIFVVGDDPVLNKTRICMLKDWQTTAANTAEAKEAIKAHAFDLLIFGQTVPDETAKNLIALANKLHPPATSLVICAATGRDRHFGTATYRIDLSNPGGFRSSVARLLDARPNTGSLRP
jgi:hypothetical protein